MGFHAGEVRVESAEDAVDFGVDEVGEPGVEDDIFVAVDLNLHRSFSPGL
jgi:hypothetical protein